MRHACLRAPRPRTRRRRSGHAGADRCMLRVRAVLAEENPRLHELVVGIVARDECAGVSCAFPASARSGPWHSRQRSTIRRGSATPRGRSLSRADAAALAVRQTTTSRDTSRKWATGTSATPSTRPPTACSRDSAASAIKAWGEKLKIAKGRHKAPVAVARKLAVTMQAMWRDGSEFELNSAGPMGAEEARSKAMRLLGQRPQSGPGVSTASHFVTADQRKQTRTRSAKRGRRRRTRNQRSLSC